MPHGDKRKAIEHMMNYYNGDISFHPPLSVCMTASNNVIYCCHMESHAGGNSCL